MKILFCTNSLGADGGIQRVTTVKANALADIYDNEVWICYTDRGSFPKKQVYALSSKVHTIDLRTTFWDLYPINFKNLLLSFPIKFFKCYRAISKIIKEINPDIIISTGQYEKFPVATISLLHRILRRRQVFVREYHFSSVYRRYINSSWRGALAARAMELMEKYVVGSMFDKNYLLTYQDKSINFSSFSRFDYMHNPTSFEPPTLQDFKALKKEKIVVAVGRLVYQKWFESLLRAWNIVKMNDVSTGWELLILGEGDERKKLERLISSLELSDSVTLKGNVSNVEDFLRRANIICSTSRYEGLQLGLIEGMSFGCVPIAYKHPYGPEDIIKDEFNGFLVEYGNYQDFATRILDLMSNAQLLENLSYEAYKRSSDFTIKKIINEWLIKYLDLLAQKKH